MQFAFTEKQELLRREAREALGNGGGSRDEVAGAELSFLDRAVLYEEAGRANVGESLFDHSRPEDEQLAALALEAVGHLREGARARRRVRVDAGAVRAEVGVYQAVSHQLADTYVETELARSLAYWAAWCVPRATSRRPSQSPPRRRTRATRPSRPASARSRCTAASASPGSTCCTPITSARSAIQAYGGYGRVHRAKVAAQPAGLNRGGREMNGQMMDFQLTLPPLLRRAETFFSDKEIVTRLPDKSFHRYTYATGAARAGSSRSRWSRPA